jgi:hypothetical protein
MRERDCKVTPSDPSFQSVTSTRLISSVLAFDAAVNSALVAAVCPLETRLLWTLKLGLKTQLPHLSERDGAELTRRFSRLIDAHHFLSTNEEAA